MNTKVSTGHYGEGLHVTGHFPCMAKLQTGRGKPLYSSYSHQSKPVGEDEVKERWEKSVDHIKTFTRENVFNLLFQLRVRIDTNNITSDTIKCHKIL